MSIHTIEPGLLLAAPRMGDPNFEGTAWLPAAADAKLLFKGTPETIWQRAYAGAIGTIPAAFVGTTRGAA